MLERKKGEEKRAREMMRVRRWQAAGAAGGAARKGGGDVRAREKLYMERGSKIWGL